MSKENEIRGYLKSFENEVKRRKEVLRCGIEGIADEYDIKYGLLVEGQTKPKFSAEMALHHMKGIQVYEKCVEKLKNCLDNYCENIS